MKHNLTIYVIMLISLLTGCNKNNNYSSLDTERLSFNINDVDKEIKDKISRSGDQNSIRNKISGSNVNDNDPVNIYNKSPFIEDLNEELYFSATEDSPLAEYTTKILTNDNNRYNNIKIVADRLNGHVVKPNEEFSFNTTCGPYGKDDGFLEATILLSDGTHEKGYGGGVCQLSSTLYNVVKDLRDIEITERHNHSVPVAYVPINQDATISLQSDLDFKFKNKYDFPIIFKTSHTPDTLNVSVYKK